MSWFKKIPEQKEKESVLSGASSIASRRMETSSSSFTSTITKTEIVNGVIQKQTTTTTTGGLLSDPFRGSPMRSAMLTNNNNDFRNRSTSVGSSFKFPGTYNSSLTSLQEDSKVFAPPTYGRSPTSRSTPTSPVYQQPSVSINNTQNIKEMNGVLKILVTKSNKRYDVEKKIPTYSTYSRNRGKMIMINNVMFNKDPEMKSYRKGAEVDETNLKELFKQMGFTVQSHKNLTKKQMVNSLQTYSQKSDLKSIDINVVILMSHGYGNSRGSTDISGIDHELLSTADVIEMFDAKKCPNLQNKPKIFIFQCCRGDQKQDVEHDAHPFVVPKIQSDILIAYSTIPGYVSNRNPTYGTWYIQAICKVFMENAHDTDVEGLLKIVEEMLNTLAKGTGYSQTSSYENRGFKTCYLHPK